MKEIELHIPKQLSQGNVSTGSSCDPKLDVRGIAEKKPRAKKKLDSDEKTASHARRAHPDIPQNTADASSIGASLTDAGIAGWAVAKCVVT